MVLERELGRGFYGVVFRGQWRGRGVAVKALTSAADATQQQAFLAEAERLFSLQHEHIVVALGLARQPQPLLVLELLPLGALDNYLRAHCERINTNTLMTFTLQTARALAFLEQHGVVHRDVAARNVLVASATAVKLGDFGLARASGYVHSPRSQLPLLWYPPEATTHTYRYTSKHDVWSWAGK
mgnify:CR=1 FL=1